MRRPAVGFLESLESRCLLADAGFISVGSKVFFNYGDAEHGQELWATDGTAEGTGMMGDINPGPASLVASRRQATSNRLFFIANERVRPELWTSDGTPIGTRKAAVLNKTMPRHWHAAAAGDKYYYVRKHAVWGSELFVTDGTPGSLRALDIVPRAGSSLPANLTPVGDRLIFTATGADGKRAIYGTDGTSPQKLIDEAGIPATLMTMELGSTRLLTIKQERGTGLWVTDGTAAGTSRIAVLSGPVRWSDPSSTVAGSRIYFMVHEGKGIDSLWCSDGTVTGTVEIRQGSQLNSVAELV